MGVFARWVVCMALASDVGGGGLTGELNQNPMYNCTTLLNNNLNADNENPLNINIGSFYFDILDFTKKFANSKNPIYLSLNIQCLMRKHESLKSLIHDLRIAKVPVDAIAIQETWSIPYPELVHIPGFQSILFSAREGMRGGGGVGFYIREGLHFDKINNLFTFHL